MLPPIRTFFAATSTPPPGRNRSEVPAGTTKSPSAFSTIRLPKPPSSSSKTAVPKVKVSRRDWGKATGSPSTNSNRGNETAGVRPLTKRNSGANGAWLTKIGAVSDPAFFSPRKANRKEPRAGGVSCWFGPM